MNNQVFIFTATLCVLLGNVAFGGDKAKITVKAVDEDGTPLAGINVDARFSGGTERKGRTDTNGLFVLEGEAEVWTATYFLQKVGYYDSQGKYIFNSNKNGKWQPWNPMLTAVLKRVINPIPMYAKKVESYLPTTNGFSAFDMMTGDWVAPYGKGINGDILFAIEERRVSTWKDFNGTLCVFFSNEKDGLHEREEATVNESDYKWHYVAPIDGYVQHERVIVGYVMNKGYFETNYTAASYIRIRTVTNGVGQIVQAYYGKIAGAIKFDVRDSPTGWVNFTYYLNPTPNDRNMEFDPKRNLLQNLKSTEEVRYP